MLVSPMGQDEKLAAGQPHTTLPLPINDCQMRTDFRDHYSSWKISTKLSIQGYAK